MQINGADHLFLITEAEPSWPAEPPDAPEQACIACPKDRAYDPVAWNLELTAWQCWDVYLQRRCRSGCGCVKTVAHALKVHGSIDNDIAGTHELLHRVPDPAIRLICAVLAVNAGAPPLLLDQAA